ncbi:MAG: efflux transporter outer membrane subunit [Sulfurovaceae bacterium]
MQYTNKLKLIIATGCIAYLSGCSALIPEYKRPLSPIPSGWDEGNKTNVSLENNHSFMILWEEVVVDEQLRHVLQIAFKQSRSLREAVASIESAKATYNMQRASEFPMISAVLSGNKGNSLSSPSTTQNYSATARISSYELDLFGKAHSLSAAEYEKYLSTQESQHALRITLISEIVTAWLTLASDKNLLELSRSTEASAKKTLDLMQRKVDLGASSALDLYEAQTLYYQAQADIAKYKTKVEQDKNAINLLAGEIIDDKWLPEGFNVNKKYLASVPTNMPSSVLLNRPDILAAEHDLKSANANIGAARAVYFPSISITAEGGLVSAALSNLFSGGATSVWSFVPSITLPIFDIGIRKSNLDYAKAQRNYYIAAYELAIQTAFKEAADALARRQTINNQLDAQKNLVKASKNSYLISELRYKNGVDTYLNALVAQRTYYSAQQTLLLVQLEEMINRIALYRALGGREK